MKPFGAASAAVCLGLLASPAMAEDISEKVSKATKEWDAAFNKQDAKTVTGYYTDDATLLPPAEVTVKGADDIQKFWQSLFDAGFKDHTVETISTEASGDHAYQTGTWSAKGGDGKEYRGRIVKIMERKGGTWKTKVHTWNLIQ